MPIKKGGFARIKTPVTAGKIIRTTYDDEADQKLHTLRWRDEQGNRHERALLESELEECEAPANVAELEDLPDDQPPAEEANPKKGGK